MEKELWKGNEAIAEAAVAAGDDAVLHGLGGCLCERAAGQQRHCEQEAENSLSHLDDLQIVKAGRENRPAG